MRQIRLNRFEYHDPATVEEASRLLRELPSAVVIAGGTDLIPLMKHEKVVPSHLVSISKIDGIRAIESGDGALRIGAGTRLATLIESEEVGKAAPLLSHTAGLMASPQVRNLATIGGNIANSSPSADSVPSLYVLGARFSLQNGTQSREMDAEEFFTGPGENVLQRGEILREIVLPAPGEGFRAHYLKHTVKRGLELAVAGVAISLRFDSRKKVKEAKIALGAVAPTPIRAREAEGALVGEKPTTAVLERAASLAGAAADPIDDVRGSRWYRCAMVELLVKRGLTALGGME